MSISNSYVSFPIFDHELFYTDSFIASKHQKVPDETAGNQSMNQVFRQHSKPSETVLCYSATTEVIQEQ